MKINKALLKQIFLTILINIMLCIILLFLINIGISKLTYNMQTTWANRTTLGGLSYFSGQNILISFGISVVILIFGNVIFFTQEKWKGG